MSQIIDPLPSEDKQENRNLDEEFNRLFYDDDEIRCFRTFPPKGGSGRNYDGTLRDLRKTLEQENTTKGIYFCPNAGGQTDEAITQINACFMEDDDRPIDAQHARLDACPLRPTARVETKRSVHAHWKVKGPATIAEFRQVQRGLIAHFGSDKSITNPSRVMRLAGFDHIDKKDGSRKPIHCVELKPELSYTIEELLAAFPAPPEEERETKRHTNGTYATWDALRAELGRRITAHESARQNAAGNWDCMGVCHGGEGLTGLFYTPATNKAHCNAKCKQPAILRAFGLPERPDVESPRVGTIANLDTAMSVIEADPDFCPVWWDEFHQRMFTGDPPREWDDQRDLEVTRAFQRDKSLPKMSLEIVQKAVTMIAHANPRNQVRDWFDALVWDGIERLVAFFILFCHAEDSAYIRKVGLNFFIAMVARVYRPGCQVDHVPVLEGPQGIGKSQLVRAIGGPWFAEQHENVFSKDFHLGNQGKLVVEIGELHAFRRDIEKVKQVITAVTDRYREPYGRRATDHPRQCVFVGTTNRSDWLADETGGRRFWPIACRGAIDVEGVKKNREQLFAEAVHRYRNHETWWEMPVAETLAQQAERYTAPAWVEKIEKYIRDFAFHDPPKPCAELTVSEVLDKALAMSPGQWKKTDEMRVGEALVYLGWEKQRPYRDGRYPVIWFPPKAKEAGGHS